MSAAWWYALGALLFVGGVALLGFGIAYGTNRGARDNQDSGRPT